MRKLNRDLLATMPVKSAATAAMTVIDGIQTMPPHEQLVGLASVFLIVAETQGIPAQDAFTIVKNIMNDAEGKRVEFQALRAYAENEL